MTEERTTRVQDPDGSTHTTTTVVHDEPARSGGSGWLIALGLIIAVIAAIWFFTQQSGSEIAKDNAVAGAAEAVEGAAESVDQAADSAREQLDGE